MDENKKVGQENKVNIQALHTYESDMARAIRDNNGSMVKISLAEQKKKEAEMNRNKNIKVKSKNFTYVFVGIILIGLVFLGANFVTKLIKDRSIKKVVVEKNETFFAVESQTILSADSLVGKESSAQVILATFKEKSKPGEMNVLFFKKGSDLENKSLFLSTQEFISRIGFSMPGPLVRSLSDKMTLGEYTLTGENNPYLFLVFNTNDYDQAFRGMLDWENGLFGDMFPFLDIKITNENKYLLDKKWEDLLIDNNDARILRDANNEPVLYYMFLDRNIFLISPNLDTIKEISKRLRVEKLKN